MIPLSIKVIYLRALPYLLNIKELTADSILLKDISAPPPPPNEWVQRVYPDDVVLCVSTYIKHFYEKNTP